MRIFNFHRRAKHARNNTRVAATASSSATPAAAALPTRRATTAPRFPEAIPCNNYYDLFPEDAGPMGHVVIDDSEDMCVWKLIAKPISPDEALKKGGCIQYIGDDPESTPRYYEFTHDAEEVYGTASYEKVLPDSPVTSDYVVTKLFPANKQLDVNASSYGGLSDEGLTDAQTLIG